jgi:hypothetical protein
MTRALATRYRTHREATAVLSEYIEVFFNCRRRHSSIDSTADSVHATLNQNSANERQRCFKRWPLEEKKIGNLTMPNALWRQPCFAGAQAGMRGTAAFTILKETR